MSSVPICLQPRAIDPRGGEIAPTEHQPRNQGLFKTNTHSVSRPLCGEQASCYAVRVSVVSTKLPDEKFFPVSAQDCVYELDSLMTASIFNSVGPRVF